MGGRAQKWVEQIKGEGIAMLAVAGAGVPNGAVQKPVLKRATVTRAGSPEMKAMLLFSTTTGNTETAAGYIAAATGLEATDIGDASVDDIKAADSLIIGAPTWHTGADSERSGTAWDEFLYGDLTGLDLKGKKVAIFGMGDQAGTRTTTATRWTSLNRASRSRARRSSALGRRRGTNMRSRSRSAGTTSWVARSTRTTSRMSRRGALRSGSSRSRARASRSEQGRENRAFQDLLHLLMAETQA